MAEIYWIATLNINGLSPHTTVTMLGEFLRIQEIDIILLQEVTQPFLDTIRGYSEYTDIGTNRRGTAILMREQITLTNITRLPSERGMVTEYQGVWLINVCAPSGAARRQERESFFNI
jgi:exonuclease III